MRPSLKKIIATCGILLFVGSSCAKSDVSLLVDFVNGWLESRGIVDEKGNPTAQSIGIVAGGGYISSGDETTDAVTQAGGVVNSIKDADKQLEKADEAMAKVPPDTDAALAAANAAEKMRPKDQHVRHKKGLILMQSGNAEEAAKYSMARSVTCEIIPGIAMSDAGEDRCIRRLHQEDRALGGKSDCASLALRRDVQKRLSIFASTLDESNRYRQSAETIEAQMANQGCGS